MHTSRFRSLKSILETDETDLIHDVSCNPDRARTKLGLISKRLTGIKQHSALEIEQLTEAQAKLSAAISAAREKPKIPARRRPCGKEGSVYRCRVYTHLPQSHFDGNG
jgi:hypothetical protein